MVELKRADAATDDAASPRGRDPARRGGGPMSWDRELNRVRRDLVHREQEVARLRDLAASLQAQITQTRSSTSWRVTAPLRWLSRRFRRFFRPILRASYWLVTFQIAERLHERRLARRIRASGLFDATFYASEYPDIPADIDVALHYVLFGAAEGRDPSPGFSTAAYLAAHPEAGGKGRNPLIHYLETRHRETPATRRDWRAIAPPVPALKAAVRAALQAAAEAAEGIEPAPPVLMVSASPEVSIVVIAGEDRPRLARCLRALGLHLGSIGAEVSVVGKSGSGIEGLSKAAGAKFLDAGTNPPSAWRNLAAREAKGAYLVFLDDGVVVLPGWLEVLLETFDRFPDAGAVGAYRLRGDGLGGMAGGAVHSDGGLGAREETAPVGHHDFASAREVDFCPLSALAVPTETWDLLGGIDEHFDTAIYQAADLAMRLRAAGHRVLCQPFSRVAAVAERQDGDMARSSDDRARFLVRWHGALGPGGPPPETSRRLRHPARPRALFIDQMTPTPDRDAGSALVCGYMRILQGLGYEVTFAPAYRLDHAGRHTDELRKSGIICICAPFVPDLASFIEQEAAGFDLVVFWRVVVASRYLGLVRQTAPNARIVFHTVDLHYLREQREARLDGSRETAVRAEQTRGDELAAIGDADCTILVSEHEAEVIASVMPNAQTRVIPLVVEIPGRLAPLEGRRDVVFIGGFSHQPNIDAVMFLVTEVWPRVHRALPSARLIVIGGDPPADIERLDDPEKGVEIRGWVEDLTQTLRSCRLTVAPLRFGAGVKGKIVTSLAHGVPCVATPVAVEGMGLQPGRHVMVAEQASELADAVIELYGNAQLWQSLSEAGLDFARRHFSVDTVTAQIGKMLTGLGLPAGETSEFDPPLATVELASLADHVRYAAAMADVSRRRREVELGLISGEVFQVPGFCISCRKPRAFQVDLGDGERRGGGPAPSGWQEQLRCGACALDSRSRAAVHFLKKKLRLTPDSKLYLAEQTTPLHRRLLQFYPNAVAGGHPGGKGPLGGTDEPGRRDDDLTRLSFPDESFDAILSFDTLAHIPDYRSALREWWRCVKPGGTLILSVPFNLASPLTVSRTPADGRGEHDFGWELIGRLHGAGFRTSALHFFWSHRFAYLGDQFLIVARKAVESDAPLKAAPMAQAMQPHRVSVVVPLYNHERYIEATLRSALTQTMPAHEIIVVDDGSTDGSAALVDRMRERHPQILLWSKENGGAHSAINAGIQGATGDLVAILNSDDIYRPDRLAVMLQELDRRRADAVVTGLDFIDDDGRVIRNSWYEEGIAFHRRTRDLALTLVNGNILMTTSNLLARRALFQEIGGFSPLRYAHDLDFFLRLIVRGKSIRIVEQPLLSYRQHATNTIKEDTLKVKAEWAVAAAFFLHEFWGTGDATDWRRAREFLAVLDHHGLIAPVLLCMAYFRQHPSASLEESPFHADAAFRTLLADIVR
jgi:glycosyltransferase involved in cell wall biosynthesis